MDTVDYAEVREFLLAHGFSLIRIWPRPCHVFADDKMRLIVFAVRDRRVRRTIFERLKRQVQSYEEDV